jgi:ferredoxin
MPKLTIDAQTFDVAAGTRLVNAIEDCGTAIGHRCGGKAKCATCRVVFVAGEPSSIATAEHAKLVDKGIYGESRLSCQILVDHDMSVSPQMTLASVPDWSDTGPRCLDSIEPEPTFVPKSSL